jgi:hypothetical protein
VFLNTPRRLMGLPEQDYPYTLANRRDVWNEAAKLLGLFDFPSPGRTVHK